MRRAAVVLVVLGSALTNVAFAGYTIDGSLSDWGVTPFSHWAPTSPTASYRQTAGVNEFGVGGWSPQSDFEAMYFDSDAKNLYVAVVTANDLRDGTGGDLGIDLNHDMHVGPAGRVTGLEYAMRVGTDDLGQVLSNPVWVDTWSGAGAPYYAQSGTLLGIADVAITRDPDLGFGGTTVVEASIPRNLFPNDGGVAGDSVGLHITIACGNDSIDLFGTLNSPVPPPPTPPVVPAPGALVLTSLGVGLLGWFRRRGGQL